jgi:Flp pilus assembly protein TadB
MIGIILSALTGLLAALFVIKKENDKLKNKQKLHELELNDAKFEIQQVQVKKEKDKVVKQLEELEETQAPSLSDSQIEDFWNKK